MKNDFKTEDQPWQTLVSICEKCGKKLDNKNENPSHDLRAWLKEEIKSNGLKGKVRAVTSSCLDVCPDGKVAISFTGKSAPECISVNPDEDRRALLEKIILRAGD